MKPICSLAVLFCVTSMAGKTGAYIEVPHSLGKCLSDSTNVVLMEVVKVNAEKNLIIFKKVGDIKGKHPTNEIKHNIGKKGFHEREWKNIMAWAEPGKKAVFLYNGDASETCIGTYWYQCYREGEWWGMSHAEPFLLRTFYGDAEKLAELLTRMTKGEEVVATCLADGSKEQLHQRKGKLQRMKVSLKKVDYNPKRDFVGWGADGEIVEEFKTEILVPESTAGWVYRPAKTETAKDWMKSDFNENSWTKGKAPIGYGEEEIANRKGTTIPEKGQPFLFRRAFVVTEEMLKRKDVQFFVNVASDDNATLYLNGKLIDKDPEEDHEFAYWNREVELKPTQLVAGRNVLAAYVKNQASSSDLYLDAEVIVRTPIPRPKKTAVVAKGGPDAKDPKTAVAVAPKMTLEPRDPKALIVDKATKSITIVGRVAPRKLPQYDQIYPIEVVGTLATPRGQKAHETMIAFAGVRPSDIHKALVEMGLKPGKPAIGEGTAAVGPEVAVYLEFTANGKTERLPPEKCLIHRETKKPMVPLKWYFTGSAMKLPDPEKDDQVYGADLTGTFLSLFPVTDCCVLQTHLTMKDEPNYKLDVDPKVMPNEGTPVRLVIVLK
jgi:hypothetical protein